MSPIKLLLATIGRVTVPVYAELAVSDNGYGLEMLSSRLLGSLEKNTDVSLSSR